MARNDSFPRSVLVACDKDGGVMDELNKSMRIDDAARYLAVSVSFVRKQVKAGVLLCITRKPLTFLREDLDAWRNKQRRRHAA